MNQQANVCRPRTPVRSIGRNKKRHRYSLFPTLKLVNLQMYGDGITHGNRSWPTDATACLRAKLSGEEAQLSAGAILIAKQLSSDKFNSSVRAEQLFAICYPNVAIGYLCSSPDICLNYYTITYWYF